MRMPDVDLRTGRGLLLGSAPEADGWADRVDRAAGEETVLVRPDGYVCWAGGPGTVADALTRWFGAPVSAVL